jgi:hypothetical protein
VLFGDVELQKGDDAARLRSLGLTIEQKGKKLRFLQPCSCFDGTRCRIYSERPVRCRTFECRLLRRVEAREVPLPAALKTVEEARGHAESVRRLVCRLGQTDEQLPLVRRYSQAMASPIDLAGDEKSIRLRGELLLAVHRLVEVLEREFLTPNG